METVNIQSSEIINEYKESLNEILENEKSELIKEIKHKEDIEIDSIKKNIHRFASKQSLEIKRALSIKQKELTDKIFDEVIMLLEQFKNTDDYFDLLLKQIKETVLLSKNDKVIIYIDSNDKHLLNNLALASEQELTLSQYSFMGGTRAIITSKNLLIDNSFEVKIAEAKETFNISI